MCWALDLQVISSRQWGQVIWSDLNISVVVIVLGLRSVGDIECVVSVLGLDHQTIWSDLTTVCVVISVLGLISVGDIEQAVGAGYLVSLTKRSL